MLQAVIEIDPAEILPNANSTTLLAMERAFAKKPRRKRYDGLADAQVVGDMNHMISLTVPVKRSLQTVHGAFSVPFHLHR